MMVDNAIQNMQSNLEKLNRLQGKTTSGKQFQKISEDPVAAAFSLSLRSSLQAAQSYSTAASAAGDWMTASDAALGQMESLALLALNKARAGATDSMSGFERKAFAVEIKELIEQVLQEANTKFQDSYLFSGYQVRTKPYQVVPEDPSVPDDADSVRYDGDGGSINRNIGPQQLVSVNVDGRAPFVALFDAMIAARDALQANDGDGIRTTVSLLEGAMHGITNLRGDLGSRQRAVHAAVKKLEDQQFSIETLLSEKEDLSLAEAIAELRHQETTYQAVLEVSQRTLAMTSLFDYLR
jgi:flagellar hook-associated protein 3 FlgL